jgi:hypothetical protein
MRKKKVTYQVWALGYDAEQNITDWDDELGDFKTQDEAIDYAESLTLEKILGSLNRKLPERVKYLDIQVETVVDHGSWDENIETVWETLFDLEED